MVCKRQRMAAAFPPGDMLREKLDELGMPIKEFALRCCKPEPTIHAVLQGKSSVTSEMAILFEKVLGIPAHLWLSMQCQYDEYVARRKHESELKGGVKWAENFPFSEMVAKGFLTAPAHCDSLEKLESLLDFFGFAKPDVWKKYYEHQVLRSEFSLSLSGLPDAFALSAWIRFGEKMASGCTELPSFSVDGLKAALPEMQELANSSKEDFLQDLKACCKRIGIILICTPHLRGSGAQGATRWLKDNPFVQIVDSYKRYDTFWFTFFHEIGHILLHGKREVFLEGIDYHQKDLVKEKEADDFAAERLIPRSSATKLLSFKYSKNALNDFCKQEHLHWAFVVGRLQQLKLLTLSKKSLNIPSVQFTV